MPHIRLMELGQSQRSDKSKYKYSDAYSAGEMELHVTRI
jgi:hypothetical protein